MRTMLAVALVALIAVPAALAQEKERPKPPPITLKAGDPAPAFKPDKWFQGDPSRHSARQVYVVEFWAWCGLHRHHAAHGRPSRGVQGKITFIGFSAPPRMNSQRRNSWPSGPNSGTTSGRTDNPQSLDDRGRSGIPVRSCDKEGKIAYPATDAWTWSCRGCSTEPGRRREGQGGVGRFHQGLPGVENKDLSG